jgi:PPOX class probable FMN-dependent enzyme
VTHRLTHQVVATVDELRSLIGMPTETVCAKITDRLNPLTAQYVERSPFVVLGTSGPDGTQDVSPRGDPPGFVRILDERTLLLPERPGNRLADTLTNILAHPRIAMWFLVPGVTETFRVNGRATLTTDATLLGPCAVEEKVPVLGILVDVEEAYTQCSKASLRAQLWDPERFVDPSLMPTNGQIHRVIRGDDFDADAYDAERAERYRRREGFY